MTPLVIEHLCRDVPHGFLGRKLRLLNDLSFEVGAGQTVGFVGRNGAGKTTTIRTIVGLSKPTSGKVQVYGGLPSDANIRRQVGYLPESVLLPGSLTVVEVLRLHASLAGVGVDERASLLEVDLLDVRNRLVRDLSKGMQTRLGLALVFLPKPKLLVLDEPMSGLDPVGRELVRDLLRRNASEGVSTLFSSHVLSDVEALSDRVVVIDGFSKSHAMTGWRVGWVHGPAEIIDACTMLQQYTFVCAPQAGQWGAIAALDAPMDIPLAECKRKRDKLMAGIAGHYRFVKPGGAFYLYPEAPGGSGKRFAEAAAEQEKLIVVPGSVFGAADTHFRIAYTVSDRTLDRGIAALIRLAGAAPDRA